MQMDSKRSIEKKYLSSLQCENGLWVWEGSSRCTSLPDTADFIASIYYRRGHTSLEHVQGYVTAETSLPTSIHVLWLQLTPC